MSLNSCRQIRCAILMYSITRRMEALKPKKGNLLSPAHKHATAKTHTHKCSQQHHHHKHTHTFRLLNSTKSVDGPLESLEARKLITHFALGILGINHKNV